jgi:hypothetical protein
MYVSLHVEVSYGQLMRLEGAIGQKVFEDMVFYMDYDKVLFICDADF